MYVSTKYEETGCTVVTYIIWLYTQNVNFIVISFIEAI